MHGNMKELRPWHVQHATPTDPLAVAAVCDGCLQEMMEMFNLFYF